jgi:DNA transformation protein
MTPEYRTWLIERFAPLGDISIRRVFGFHGLYFDGTMFGLAADARVYLKTDAESRNAFEQEGANPLRYAARDGENIVTSYWEVPARLLDEPDDLAEWARKAYRVAVNSPTALRKQTRKAKQESPKRPARKRNRS